MTTFANQLKSYAQGLYKESPEAVAVGILVKQAGLSEQEATDLVLTSSIEKAACDALAAKGARVVRLDGGLRAPRTSRGIFLNR